MTTINIIYQGDLRCQLVHGPSGATMVTDAPPDHDGLGRSFAPTDLMAASYASCVVTAMAIDAHKKGIDMSGTTATVVKEIAPQPPRRIGKLIVEVKMPAKLTAEERKFLEHIAHTCPVKHSLHPEVECVLRFIYAG